MGIRISWKSLMAAFLGLLLVAVAVPVRPSIAAEPVKVQLDGKLLQMDVPAVIEDGRTLIPLRAIMEALGAAVTWDPATKTATVVLDGHTVALTLGKKYAIVDGKTVQLDVPAKIVSDRTLVPVRFVVEATGGEVDWLADQNTVVLVVRDDALKVRIRLDKAERTLPRDPPTVSKEAAGRGFKLLKPAVAYAAVDGVVHVEGLVGPDLEGDIVVAVMESPWSADLQTALEVKNGKFSGDIYLPDGAGEYVLHLRLPTQKGSTALVSATDLKVRNVALERTQGIFVDRLFWTSGLRIESPAAGHITADNWLTIRGTAPSGLNGRVLMLKSTGHGSSWTSYGIIQDGRFTAQAYVGDGEGPYTVELLLESSGGNWYETVANLQALNTNSQKVPFLVHLTPDGLKRGVTLDSIPAVVSDGYLTISGRVGPQVTGSSLWVKMEKGWDTDDKTFIPIVDGRFSGKVPLTLGKSSGYKFRLFVPDGGSYWIGVAEIYPVANQSETALGTIQYSGTAYDLKVTVTEPQTEVLDAGDSITLSGTVGTDDWAYPYITVETTLGDVEARYRVPIQGGKYSAEIPFRFGAGRYEVTLYQQQSSFRLARLASFMATTETATDQRDLLPSFGIESDHPDVIALSQRLTAGKDSYEAGRAVYEWVAQNVSYDVGKARWNSVEIDEGALRTLTTRYGVCRDYAALAVALLRAASIEAHIVVGTADGLDHAWVEFKSGDRWVTMDPTFGAGSVGLSFHAEYDPRFFDPSTDLFTSETRHARKGIQY